ncbi:hypothetical protein P8629_04580 [Hydrogenovibrio sp. 3SP14C1]|uniref:hypothetical protein n=1 Tax=Hydrogenovibrio sp. 3SP14C1 TaxID=3038774 RepID=UPI002416BE94|nr:hypothetical protein [Hydrogenovibrio sp. 3SP14C1]MDG4812275.1 hypothetical protein [Hydrogenovibrio sp. 3SP14C1]
MKKIWSSVLLLGFLSVYGCSSTEERAYEKEYQKDAAEKSHQELSREADKLD